MSTAFTGSWSGPSSCVQSTMKFRLSYTFFFLATILSKSCEPLASPLRACLKAARCSGKEPLIVSLFDLVQLASLLTLESWSQANLLGVNLQAGSGTYIAKYVLAEEILFGIAFSRHSILEVDAGDVDILGVVLDSLQIVDVDVLLTQ